MRLWSLFRDRRKIDSAGMAAQSELMDAVQLKEMVRAILLT